MKNVLYLSLFFVLAATFVSCVPDEEEIREEYYYPEELQALQATLDLPAKPHDYSIELPRHLTAAGLGARNINKDMATLGRVLFYDEALSVSGEVSCASCHAQALAFSDSKAASDGVNGNVTERNSIALGSVASFAAYYGIDVFGSFGIPFMWDNRFGTAREQARAAFLSEKEMGLTMEELLATIDSKDYYKPLFRRAFGSTDVSEERMMGAVAEFIDGLGSFNSKFDQAATNANAAFNMSMPFADFTDAENNGKALYLAKCANCHSENFGRPVKTEANNGLDVNYADMGVGEGTNNPALNYTFKVPTLRNVMLSAPYMHDGRFETLEDVIDHYSKNIADHPKLSPELRDPNGQPKRFNFTEEEKADLVAFLNTLTDEGYLMEERYSDPFK
ncbi:MAG: cytochrome c peroxidase [Bacteroidota bacterium]